MLKQTLSIFALTAQSTMKKLILILLTMVAVESVIFYVTSITNSEASLVQLLDMRYYIPLLIGAITYCSVLLRNTKGKEIGQFVSRSPVKHTVFGFTWAIYDFLCLIVLWAAMVFITFLICKIYLVCTPSGEDGHLTTMIFSYNLLPRWLLPLSGFAAYAKKLLIFAGLALIFSGMSIPAFRKKLYPAILFTIFLLILIAFMLRRIEIFLITCCIIFILLSVMALYYIATGTIAWKNESEDIEDKEEEIKNA